MTFKQMMNAVDPNNAGFVTFDAFMRFMTRQASGSETTEQLVDSFRVIAHDSVSRSLSFSLSCFFLFRLDSYLTFCKDLSA